MSKYPYIFEDTMISTMQWNFLIRTPLGPVVLSFVERLSSFRGDFYRVCIHEYFWLVLCWKVCPLLEVLLYIFMNVIIQLFFS